MLGVDPAQTGLQPGNEALVRASSAISEASAASSSASSSSSSAAGHSTPSRDTCSNIGSASGRKRSRRRTRTRTQHFEPVDSTASSREEQLLQLALQKSRTDTHREASLPVSFAPEYRPTVEEFADPLQYIERIRKEASAYGICKVIPPEGWTLPDPVAGNIDSGLRFPTKHQPIHTLQEGEGFDDGPEFTMREFRDQADAFRARWLQEHHPDLGSSPSAEELYGRLAEDYWSMVELHTYETTVKYGNDLDAQEYWSGFPRPSTFEGAMSHKPASRQKKSERSTEGLDEMTKEHETDGHTVPDVEGRAVLGEDEDFYARTGWNLHLLPRLRGSVMRHVEPMITGVNAPWVYLGMLFASFCWHAEDNFLYSINYMHSGEAKQWYGVPGKMYKRVEKLAKRHLAERFHEDPDLLYHMTLQFPPSSLQREKIPVYQLHQHPGEFVLTFPQAFHAGFSYGFNCAEAVNFAPPHWMQYSRLAIDNYREHSRPSVLSHERLMFTIAQHPDDLTLGESEALLAELNAIIAEERHLRAFAVKSGIFDLSQSVVLPRPDLRLVDDHALSMDDKRMCYICEHACVFTAVICSCSDTKVSCVSHARYLCKCDSSQKFMLAWASDDDFHAYKAPLETHIQRLLSGATASSAAQTALSGQGMVAAATGRVASPSVQADAPAPVGCSAAASGELNGAAEGDARTFGEDDIVSRKRAKHSAHV